MLPGAPTTPEYLDGKLPGFQEALESFRRGDFNGPFQEEWRWYFSCAGGIPPLTYPRRTIARKHRVWFSWGSMQTQIVGWQAHPYEIHRVYRSRDGEHWVVLGDTPAEAWLDTDVNHGVYHYKVTGMTELDEDMRGIGDEVQIGGAFHVSVPFRDPPLPPRPNAPEAMDEYSTMWAGSRAGDGKNVMAYLFYDGVYKTFSQVIFHDTGDFVEWGSYEGTEDPNLFEFTFDTNYVSATRPFYVRAIDFDLQLSEPSAMIDQTGD